MSYRVKSGFLFVNNMSLSFPRRRDMSFSDWRSNLLKPSLLKRALYKTYIKGSVSLYLNENKTNPTLDLIL